jgi:hypothetical protein
MTNFTLKASLKTLCSDPNSFLNLYQEGVLGMELRRPGMLGSTDTAVALTRDEIHVVSQGSARFCSGETADPVRRGDILFIQKNKDHCYSDFTPDFGTWVFFVPDAAFDQAEFEAFSLQAA